MADREIVYGHSVRAWTVGELRKALEGLPDNTPLEVSTLEEPSSSPRQPVLETERQVLTSVSWETDARRVDAVTGLPQQTLLLLCDFPTGDGYIHYEKGW